ncbi:MAG: SHOCT domain-containing protein [Sideroxydans sp.]|nr:SHOCT domain-containing protein [Sideroxydans sp.]
MWGNMNDYGWGNMGAGMLFFWVLLGLGFALLVRYTMGTGDAAGRKREQSALDILKERYARGEIEREEFEQKKRDLEN